MMSCSSAHAENIEILNNDNENINGNFPEHVLIKTRTQSFNLYYEFIIMGGRIYSKPLNDNNASWTLFLKTGLPYYKNIQSKMRFTSPENIIEISADGDSLYASDSKGFIYHVFLSNSSPEKPFIWKKCFGWPKNLSLQQNDLVINNRGWAMGSRRKEVLWHEDIYGNPHHYGTMGLETLYFLTADGQHIRFTDSGLTVDFSRQIRGPENGQFISENIDVSADTIFLIGKNGTMYTRLIDFDTMGSDVMFFNYTYDKVDQKYTGYDYLSNYSPWALPSESWKKHKITLEGKARLSKYISIHQNGHGNAARELRVAGLNSEGKSGFFKKNITEENWEFVEAEFDIPEEFYLDSIADKAVNKTECGISLENKYSGYILKNDVEIGDIECSLSSMNLTSEEESYLSISNGKESFTTKVFLVEKWTAFRRYNTGFDGTPRNYFVTFEFNEDDLDNYSETFSNVLKDIFKGKNHKAFEWDAEGTVSYFNISGSGSVDRKLFLQNQDSNRYSICMNKTGLNINQNVYRGSAYVESDLLKKATSSELLLNPDIIYTPYNRKEITDKIRSNENYLMELKDDLKQTRDSVRISRVSKDSYNFADLLTRLTLLNRVSFPKIKQMTSHGRNLMLSNYEMYVALAMYKELGYDTVQNLINVRLESYSNILSEFDKGNMAVRLPEWLRYSYQEYLKLVGLPVFSESGDGNETSSLNMIEDTPIVPGYFMICGDGSSYFVIIKNAVESCIRFYKLDKPLSTKNPYIADIKMIQINPGESSDKSRPTYNNDKGKIYWDGSVLRISVNKKIIFEKK